MKLTEIATSASRDEHNNNFMSFFAEAPTIGVVPGTTYIFKRVIDTFGDIRYGIFTSDQSKLISYLRLDIQPNFAVVGLPSTMVEYRKQGLMSFLYSYAVNKDNLILLSDGQQTPEAKQLWISLLKHHFFNIDVFNVATNMRIKWNGDDTPWNSNDENIRLIAYKHTNEQIELTEQYSCQRGERAERRKLGMDNPELYGPTSYKIYSNPDEIAP